MLTDYGRMMAELMKCSREQLIDRATTNTQAPRKWFARSSKRRLAQQVLDAEGHKFDADGKLEPNFDAQTQALYSTMFNTNEEKDKS